MLGGSLGPITVGIDSGGPFNVGKMLQAAEPVYRLLGAGGIEANQMPEVGKLVDSTLGYYIRAGKHSMTKEDWRVFLDFADKHFGKPGNK